MLAEDRYPDIKIAELVGITERQLQNWKKVDTFAARVAEITKAYSDRALKFGLARRERRLQVLCDMHERILQVIEARSADVSMAKAAGGSTGLLTVQIKSIGSGDKAKIVPEFSVDTPLLRELRAIEVQIAEELGQRKNGGGGEDEEPMDRLAQALERSAARMAAVGKADGA